MTYRFLEIMTHIFVPPVNFLKRTSYSTLSNCLDSYAQARLKSNVDISTLRNGMYIRIPYLE